MAVCLKHYWNFPEKPCAYCMIEKLRLRLEAMEEVCKTCEREELLFAVEACAPVIRHLVLGFDYSHIEGVEPIAMPKDVQTARDALDALDKLRQPREGE